MTMRATPVPRKGFTLVEAMVSLTVIAMSAAALFLAVQTTVQARTDAMEQTIAMGLARQLIDEVLGQPYHSPESGPTAYPLGPAGREAAGVGREHFDETGDYNGYAAQPPVDMWGAPIGQGSVGGGLRHADLRVPSSYFDKFRQEVDVYYVNDLNSSIRLESGQTGDHRAVEVRILRVNRDRSTTELARLRQVFVYVPSPN
ncbi:MAG: type II secretion system protein [Planctomycetes bacterium]|nr:type II secretion system protein [Planctomycetota bacterium]MBL7041828.1 type II secretion system protein [Pirellulaceae bacterium]